ncbi:hypothetical protein IV102_28065 [bacterium]|nr:hypothetical protein [bacterium]
MLKNLARWGAGLVLTASVGGLISWPWWLELFVHFRVQYVLLLGALAPLLWRARDGAAAGLWLLSMGVNLAYLAPYYGGQRAHGPANAHLVLANVLAINRTPEKVVSFLEPVRRM